MAEDDCCGCCPSRSPGGPTTCSLFSCRSVAAAVFLIAAAVIAFLETSSPAVSYLSDGWFHECAKWDPSFGGRFLVSTFLGAGVAEVAGDGGVEKVVVADADATGKLANGIFVDTPRRRLLVVYSDVPPKSQFAAVAAYDLESWDRIFFTRLDRRGDEPSFADDVGVDEDGNAYVTDAKGNKIWKVDVNGKFLSIIRNAIFTQRKGMIQNFVGLNGILYHPNGYFLVIHTSGGDLFKIDTKTTDVTMVKVLGSLQRGDGLEWLSPTKLVVAGMPSRLVESFDDWDTANVTGQYIGPIHRVGTAAAVKDGHAYINHFAGFGFTKKTNLLAKAIFSPMKVN